jgi:hypothetical protein
MRPASPVASALSFLLMNIRRAVLHHLNERESDPKAPIPGGIPPNFPIFESWLSLGAARGIRTPDPVITNDVLYQLSYCGVTP